MYSTSCQWARQQCALARSTTSTLPPTYGCWSSSLVSFRLVTVHSAPLLIKRWHDVAVAFADDGLGQGGPIRRCPARVTAPRSSFAGFRFPVGLGKAPLR